jgi:predicted transposase YbfD/YdcC
MVVLTRLQWPRRDPVPLAWKDFGMDAQAPRGALRFFASMEDPRDNQGKRHRLLDIIAIAITGVICDANGWEDIAELGECKQEWFETFLELPHGIPSHDTFARVFARLDPDAFEVCFGQWMAHLNQTSQGRLIAVDGKTLRRSFDTAANKAAIHMINAWCLTNQTVLGQVVCEDKANEITTMPKLLQLLDLQGAVVTADAMHCQRDTARRIVEGGGDYLLAVKDNQPALRQDLELLFDQGLTGDCQGVRYDFVEDVDAGHGRIETRRCWCCEDLAGLDPNGAWAGLRSVARVQRVRQLGEEVSTLNHYYISSLPGTEAKRILEVSRGHWSVENQLHWCMDVVFHEDDRRIRAGHAAENFTRLSRIALNLLKADKTKKTSIRRKRKIAGWSLDYMLHLLTLSP